MKSFVLRSQFLVAFFLLAVGTAPLLFVVDRWPDGDMRLYRTMAGGLMAGEMPYSDRAFAYPPYVIPILLVPWLFDLGKYEFEAGHYQFAFAFLVLLADCALKCFLFWEGLKREGRLLGLLPMALYCLTVPFVRFFYLQRYDIFPSLITLGAICCLTRGWFGWSGALLMIGAGMKVYPALLVPALWSLAGRRNEAMRFMAGAGAALIPLAFVSVFLPWWRFLDGHNERGFQVESLYASIIWLAHLLGMGDAIWTPVQGCIEVKGTLAQAVIPYAKGMLMSATLASVVFSVWMARRCQTLTIFQIARLMLIPLLPFVAFNLVFSPQYMIWLLPLAALGLLGGRMWPMILIACATAVIPIFYPTAEYFTGLNLGQTVVLLSRNLSLILVWLVLLREFWCLARRKPDLAPATGETRCPTFEEQ